MINDLCESSAAELAARRAVVAAANGPRCGCCGQFLPAALVKPPEPTMGELPPPSGWRDREPLL